MTHPDTSPIQTPIGSGFTAASTAAEVIAGIDLSAKTAIVTGGYSGLGREAVRVLAAAGARVILPARDVVRAASALAGIAGRVEVWPMDLLDAASIEAFAARFLTLGQPLHILMNSAGIMAVPVLARDASGQELQFATNHLGHFRLARRLWPALAAAGAARIVSVSSAGHRFSPLVFDDPAYDRRPYDPWTAYGQSKTANALFAIEADRRGKADGIRAYSLHPGGIAGTGLERHIPRETLIAANVIDAAGNPVRDPARDLKTVEQGAATQVWCATSPQLDGIGGVYCLDSDVARLLPSGTMVSILDSHGEKRVAGVEAHAADPEAAARLWQISETLTE